LRVKKDIFEKVSTKRKQKYIIFKEFLLKKKNFKNSVIVVNRIRTTYLG
jgi:hypothetical protein